MNAPVQEGDVLAGKYRIERVLGVGGMGVVVAATHLQLDQPVALKFLLPDAMQNKEVVQRFAREARAAAKIQSEHVARVIDVGTLESGSPYMVMEYLQGRDLAQVLEERKRLPFEEAVGYVLQASEAIAEAHAASIVHRDLKPANLFLADRADKRSIVKVLDFGISKSPVGKGEEASLTRTSTLMGSPLYMSPEQMVAAKNVDARCDIWALGVILYEFVTGSPPFRADSMTEIVAHILQVQPQPPHLVAAIPAELSAVIMRCLEKDPAKRFQNVGELATGLAPFALKTQRLTAERVSRVLGTPQQTIVSYRPEPTETRPQIVAAAATNASWQKTGPEPSSTGRAGRSRVAAAIAGVVTAALLTAAGIVVLRRSGSTAASTTEHTAAAQPAGVKDPGAPVVLQPAPTLDLAVIPPSASHQEVAPTPDPNDKPPLGAGARNNKPPFGAGAPNNKPGATPNNKPPFGAGAPNDKPGAAPNDKPGARPKRQTCGGDARTRSSYASSIAPSKR
jgi:serine/threonine-protein kinase